MRRVLALCLLASVTALAQEKAASEKVAKDREATTFNEIERGLHLAVSAGLWATINPPAGTGSARYFLLGQAARVEFGYDFGERFSLALFAQATANRAGSDYTGKSQDPVSGAPRASGDYTEFIPGLTARLSRTTGRTRPRSHLRSTSNLRRTSRSSASTPASTAGGRSTSGRVPDGRVCGGPIPAGRVAGARAAEVGAARVRARKFF